MKALVIILIAAVSRGAMAGYSAEINVSDLGYRLIDLNPDDGIEPAVAIAPAPASYATGYTVLSSELRNYPVHSYQYVESGSAPVYMEDRRNFAAAHLENFWRDGQFNLVAMGSAKITSEDRAGFMIDSTRNTFFTLTPHTKMEWTGQYTMKLEADRSPGARIGDSAYVDLIVPDERGHRDIIVLAYTNPESGPASVKKSGVLDFEFENLDSAYVEKTLSISVYTTGGNYTPLPEASTYALFMSGLCAVCAYASIRRRRNPPQ